MNLKLTLNNLIEKLKSIDIKKTFEIIRFLPKNKRIALGIIASLLILTVPLVAVNMSKEIKADNMMRIGNNGEGYAIMVDGKEIAKLQTEDEANQVIEEVKNHYLTEGSEVLEVGFAEEVLITPSSINFDIDNLCTTEEALTLIITGNKEPKTYVVQGGDTIWDIALANNLSPYELMEMNPGVEDKLSIGQAVNLYQVNPYIRVNTKEITITSEKIEYNIKYENTSNLYKGQSQVKVAGNYGSKNVKAEVLKENGVVITNTIIEEEIIAEPSTQVTIVGTKTIPISTGSGQLAIPVTNIEISSAFGSRGASRHYGVDLRMPKGSPVLASDAGTVTKASYSGSFGNLIVINHGNGIQTYYSHCNSINVSIGQDVQKGDVIGTVGTTGNATGSHLHFEVRVNGTPQNPMNYF